MERGFVTFWRKVCDSRSHSRGVLHRALIETFLVEANWKPGFFCGHEIGPGQMAVSILGLAKELKVPRTTLQRAINDLVSDQFISVQNMGNRWTMITIVNWDTYQNNDNQSGQPTGNRRATTGQPAGIIKEGKKERKKEEYKITARSDKKSLQAADDSPVVISLPLISGEQWEVHQHQIDRWIERYPGVNILQQLRNMIGWCESNPTRRKTARGIARFVESWLAKEQDKAGRPEPARRLSFQEERDQRELEKFLNDEPPSWGVKHGQDPF